MELVVLTPGQFCNFETCTIDNYQDDFMHSSLWAFFVTLLNIQEQRHVPHFPDKTDQRWSGFVNIHEGPPHWAFLDTKSIKYFPKPQEAVLLVFL